MKRAGSVLSRAHGERLRSVLLAAMGLGPLAACGGATTGDGDARGGATSLGGASSSGGATSLGGASSSGGETSLGGASSSGGETSLGGASSSGGETSLGGASGSGGGGALGGGPAFPCNGPTPNDPNASYLKCEGGWYHRPKPVTCASKVPRAETLPPTMFSDVCTSDADCSAMPYGHCVRGGQLPNNYCRAGCVDDSDCGTRAICMCGEFIGVCVPASCRSDLDCGDNLACASLETAGCGLSGFACQTKTDSCISRADCPQYQDCMLDPSGVRTCQLSGCAVGRPFLVAGEVRTAGICERGDWYDTELRPSLTEIPPEVRARLAEHWRRTALMEHASVAAFARFALELLMLGAPADLVEAAAQAQRDEIGHARLAFALASAYAGREEGPGPLEIGRALENTTLEAVTLNTFLEGCVGETVAALEAQLAAERATDPVVRAVLARIAREETRHAELAFRFVRWAIQLAGPELGFQLRTALSARPAPSAESTPEALTRHGLLTEAERAALFDMAVRDVIAPCLDTLLAARRPRVAELRASESDRPCLAVGC